MEIAEAVLEQPVIESGCKLRVLVIDDEPESCDTLSAVLRCVSCRVDIASNREGALGRIRGQLYNLVFLAHRIGGAYGLELVPILLGLSPNLQIVVVTAFGSIDDAVQAVKVGASDYIQKPLDPIRIRSLVARCSEEQRQAASTNALERQATSAGEILLSSQSPSMQASIVHLRRAAAADIPVLLRGENGTGKGAHAEFLHRQSERRSKPFVTVNCPILSDELLSSELFGHVRGSFTGAVRDQPGKVEAANGGTIFLDEIGAMPSSIQSKLLRFLQERCYERVGDTQTRSADVRIVAATNHDLEEQVRAGSFREDLLYRINVIEMTLPPLRERPEDILNLARHFVTQFCTVAGRPTMALSPATQRLLLAHRWPGNIRELRNEIQRITVLWPSRSIEPEAFSARVYDHVPIGPQLGGDHSLSVIENEHIRQIIAKLDTFEEAAHVLGIEPSTLWRKRQRLGL